ncbi:type II secretion system protein [Deinococcus ruber]|uniref:Prepilin-type N-terminal cleavage/methylation domain-containing protein n=1 Tax=Deinococcus ruber TaxID=1848197 RepID=A0A918CNG6_9DEIO|nr:type II secretion system protein [Deinococcus ruber]GGR30684.1 hypothetical protein GCM10008957_46790 [Deinococcus ruber]
MKNTQRTLGFTLIELLVVIAIIAILAGLLVPSWAAAQKRPNDVAALQCGKAIVAAQITYEGEHNGQAANTVAALGNADVTEQCSGVQVGEDWQVTAAGLNTGGSNGIGVSGSNYAFKVWSQRGSAMYVYNRDAGPHFGKIN